MKVCENCKKSPSFKAMAMAINPLEFKCNHCKHIIKLDQNHMIAFILTASFIFLMTVIGVKYTLGSELFIYGAIAIEIAIISVIYYYLVIRGIMSSSLVDNV